MKPLAFIDIDGTLFRTKRCIHKDEIKDCVSKTTYGHKTCFTTEKSELFATWLASNCDIVIVSGRSEKEFARCTLPFQTKNKILADGTRIYKNDILDLHWKEHICTLLRPFQDTFARIPNDLHRMGLHGECTLRTVYDMPYCLFFRNFTDDPIPDNIKFYITKNNLTIRNGGCGHLQYFFANKIGKEEAVQYFQAKYPNRLTFAFANLEQNIPYMLNCDWLCTPNDSQISKKLAQI